MHITCSSIEWDVCACVCLCVHMRVHAGWSRDVPLAKAVGSEPAVTELTDQPAAV